MITMKMRNLAAISCLVALVPLAGTELRYIRDTIAAKAKGGAARDAAELARDICTGICTPGQMFQGGKGAPILILEERHDSVTGQIQHALALVRLHERHGLRKIALEGYLKERPPIDTHWFTRMAAKPDGVYERAKVAGRLLREGELSSAELMKLVYEDVVLLPIETRAGYEVELGQEASRIPMLYLLQLAQKSLRKEHEPQLQRLKEQKRTKEFLDLLLSLDPWVQAQAKRLQDDATFMNAEQMLTLLEEIDQRVKQLVVERSPAEEKAMGAALAFWRGRVGASKTMVDATLTIANQPGTEMVAMIAGAAHTDGICKMLRAAGRSYVVITPLALKAQKGKGELTGKMYERKLAKLPVVDGELSELLLKALPQRNKKPEPVLPQAWLQAKAELYLLTARIVHSVGGGGAGGAGAGGAGGAGIGGAGAGGAAGGGVPPRKPPFGFRDDDLKGKWISIDPNAIELLPPSEARKQQEVLFPVILNPDDPKNRSRLWVKATLAQAALLEDKSIGNKSKISVEAMLLGQLRELESKDTLETKSEAAKAATQITVDVRAIFASTKEAVSTKDLGSTS